MSQEKPTNAPSKINRNHKDIKKLLDLGVQRGFLSYVEVHELLPTEMITSEEVDEVMVMLAENEIEITDGRRRPEDGDEKEEDSLLEDLAPEPQAEDVSYEGVVRQTQIMFRYLGYNGWHWAP